MGIYEDWQIHTKTGFRPIKLQESRSDPHTNRTPSNERIYQTVILDLNRQRQMPFPTDELFQTFMQNSRPTFSKEGKKNI